MSQIRPIRTEPDYETALVRIDALMDAEPGTQEFDELDVLADLVGLYEADDHAFFKEKLQHVGV
jgi:HTH-type transcriptional regulator/antitoxin HigA